MIEFVIRSYETRDKDFVVDGMVGIQAIEFPLHDSRCPPDRAICEQYQIETLQESREKSGDFLIAEAVGEPVGFVGYWAERECTAVETLDSQYFGYICDIWTVPGFRRQGIAQLLIDEVIQKLRSTKGIARLRVTALTDNVIALAVYKRAGFTALETTVEVKI